MVFHITGNKENPQVKIIIVKEEMIDDFIDTMAEIAKYLLNFLPLFSYAIIPMINNFKGNIINEIKKNGSISFTHNGTKFIITKEVKDVGKLRRKI